MNRGQVLAVDFEKRELKGTQQNSDNDKQSFYRNKTKICNDAVTIFQTAKSGGIWHMRAYVGDADKYYQKSLRTKDKASAIDKATLEHAKLLVLKSEGKAIFSPTVYKAVEQYLQHRYVTVHSRPSLTGIKSPLLAQVHQLVHPLMEGYWVKQA